MSMTTYYRYYIFTQQRKRKVLKLKFYEIGRFDWKVYDMMEITLTHISRDLGLGVNAFNATGHVHNESCHLIVRSISAISKK